MISKFSTRRLAAGCLVAAALSFVQAPAQAQDAGGGGSALGTPLIAVVDVDLVMQDSSAAKGVRAQIDKFQQSFQDEMSKAEAGLRAKQQELDGERKSLSPEVFAEKVRAFDASVADFQRKGLLRRRALDKSYGVAMGQVQDAMVDTIRNVATARKANVVLPRAQVILFDDGMNISKEVIEALNKRLPHVDVPAPKVESDGGAKKSQ